MRIGFIPSYVLDSGIGKKVARLKGLDEGWNYPTFMFRYVRNPGPLLLFDKIVIDEEAAKQAIKNAKNPTWGTGGYETGVVRDINPTQDEVNSLESLLHSDLFEKRDIAELITDEVFEEINAGYRLDLGMDYSRFGAEEHSSQFNQALNFMIEKYGSNYASPNPKRFEAMNINLIRAISERLSAGPLDDVYRMPLYEFKMASSRQLLDNQLAFDVIEKARQVLFVPSQPIKDVDAFLSLHKDKRVQLLRKKICELSTAKADTTRITIEIIETEKKLMKLEINRFNLTIGLLGLTSGTYGMAAGDFVTGTFGAFAGVMKIGEEISKKAKSKQYEWLNLVKGLLEV